MTSRRGNGTTSLPVPPHTQYFPSHRFCFFFWEWGFLRSRQHRLLSAWTVRASWHSSRCCTHRFETLRIFCNHTRLFFGSRIAEVRFPVFFFPPPPPPFSVMPVVCTTASGRCSMRRVYPARRQANLIGTVRQDEFAWPVFAPE